MIGRIVEIGNVRIANELPAVLISGPCQAESIAHSIDMASWLSEICVERGIGFIFKASFDKANRTSGKSRRGLGIEKGPDCLAQVREKVGVPVITDVHQPDQCLHVSRHVDALQIPAFLCRQTDLLVAAGRTGLPVNIKKGQFLSAVQMQYAAAKVASTGNHRIMLCERGTFFGYGDLVNDMRSLPVMARTGYPVIYDVTHSVQSPGGEKTGGQREFIAPLVRAAAATGIAGLFVEAHDDPDNAPSDGANMAHMKDMPRIIDSLMEFDRLAKSG